MKEHKGSACHRNLPSSYDSGAQVRNRGCSLTDRLKLRATRPPAEGRGTKSVPRQGHNTPLPLKRSPPASFKRLLGSCPDDTYDAHCPREDSNLHGDFSPPSFSLGRLPIPQVEPRRVTPRQTPTLVGAAAGRANSLHRPTSA